LPRNDVCDDFNRCTDDYCTADGCVHEPNSIPCNDGVDCTDADTCADGVCAGASVCSSDSVCSDDVGTCLARDAPGKGQGVPATCKDGILDPDEECDDGVDWWLPGQACRVDCTLVPCGDVDDSGAVTAIDALMTLRTAVGIASCEPAVCNVDDSASPPTASDAFRILRVAVGVALELRCPSSV
jgi:hypothetical protein